jgi:hypothetical protein
MLQLLKSSSNGLHYRRKWQTVLKSGNAGEQGSEDDRILIHLFFLFFFFPKTTSAVVLISWVAVESWVLSATCCVCTRCSFDSSSLVAGRHILKSSPFYALPCLHICNLFLWSRATYGPGLIIRYLYSYKYVCKKVACSAADMGRVNIRWERNTTKQKLAHTCLFPCLIPRQPVKLAYMEQISEAVHSCFL